MSNGLIKKFHVFFTIILIFCMASIAYATEKKEFRDTCEEYNTKIFLFTNSKAEIEVNSNQIYIITKFLNKNNTYTFFFQKTSDLGAGGASLNWNSFSDSKPILTLKKVDGYKYMVIWHGFYDTEINKFVWTKEPDFVSPNKKPSFLYLCDK